MRRINRALAVLLASIALTGCAENQKEELVTIVNFWMRYAKDWDSMKTGKKPGKYSRN